MSTTPTKCPDCINHPGIVYAYAGPGAVKEIQCPACNGTGYAPTPDQAGERFDEAATFIIRAVKAREDTPLSHLSADEGLARIRTAADEMANARVKEAKIQYSQELLAIARAQLTGSTEKMFDIEAVLENQIEAFTAELASTEGKGVGDDQDN